MSSSSKLLVGKGELWDFNVGLTTMRWKLTLEQPWKRPAFSRRKQQGTRAAFSRRGMESRNRTRALTREVFPTLRSEPPAVPATY